jgi:hypothetical protein
MKKLIFAAALIFASPALAGNGWIALQSQLSTDSAPFTNKQALSDADLNRVITWAAVKYFPTGVLIPGNPMAVPPVPDTHRAPTGQEIFTALTNDVYANIKSQVEQYYLQQAEDKARQSVAPITITPVP